MGWTDPSWCKHDLTDREVIVRSGVAFKKGSQRGYFGRKNWKVRFMVLTASCLQYYTPRGGKLKGEVDLSRCCVGDIEIMPMDCPKTGRSKSSVWRISIRTKARRFIMAAWSEADMNHWIEALESVVLRRSSSGSSADTRPSMHLEFLRGFHPRISLATDELPLRYSYDEQFTSRNVRRRAVDGDLEAIID